MPADGGAFCRSGAGALKNFTSGPNVLSSSAGPNVPAFNGPGTKFQNRPTFSTFAPLGTLQLAPARRRIALHKCLGALFAGGIVIDDQAERHIRRDHLPGGA